jgi:predicted RNA-binding Zn-ribbon protein involved in translation (DUF1610 family)
MMTKQEKINAKNAALLKSLRANKKRAEYTKQEMARKAAAKLYNGVCPECGHRNGYESVFEDDRINNRVRLQFSCDKCGNDVDEWVVSLDS